MCSSEAKLQAIERIRWNKCHLETIGVGSQEDKSKEGNLRKGQAKNIKGNIKRKDFLWGEGRREEIGISVRGNFPSFLSVFEKGEFCG